MTTPAAGWYPDPAGSGNARWWNGTTWTEHLQAPPAPVWGAPSGQAPQWSGQPQPWGAQVQQVPATGWRRNRYSLVVAGFVLAYLLLAVYVHVFVFGILPAVFAARAIREREPLAVPAAVVAGAVVLFALYELVVR